MSSADQHGLIGSQVGILDLPVQVDQARLEAADMSGRHGFESDDGSRKLRMWDITQNKVQRRPEQLTPKSSLPLLASNAPMLHNA